MAMQAKFGQVGPKSEGLFKRVNWPQLALMDERTGDGRLLMGDGGGVRDLPRSQFTQFAQMYGHSGSVITGRVDEVSFGEDGVISGAGWIADTEQGRLAATLIAAKILYHNSVDLADVEYEYKWESDDPSDPGYWNLEGIDFTKWSIAATTGVGVPAFRDARAEIVASLKQEATAEEIVAALQTDDDWWTEITAALEADEPLVAEFTGFSLRLPAEVAAEHEMVASAAAVIMNWADFYLPESPTPQKIVVTPDGAVFGHLSMWDQPHGTTGQITPRPVDNYASFNQAGPWTEKGQVETGPIFFLGGHPDHPLGDRNANQAYGGVENAWCDVRVTAGALGPWVSGRVRPGMTEHAIHVARCSRISGHWKGNELVAIVSVNVPAFKVPGTGLSFDRGGAEFHSGQLEMVASMYGPDETPATAYDELTSTSSSLSDAQRAEVAAIVREAMASQSMRLNLSFADALSQSFDALSNDDADPGEEVDDPNDPDDTDEPDDDELAAEAAAMFAWDDADAELS